MRGKRKCLDKPQLFKRGFVHNRYVKKSDTSLHEQSGKSGESQEITTKYLRLSPGLYDQSTVAESDVPRLFDHSGNPVDVRVLRPKRSQPESSENCKNVAEKSSYRIFHCGKVEELWNIGIAGHRDWSPRCRGRLEWDMDFETQWGLCWMERLLCKSCQYQSPSMKLYDEVQAGKPGRKSGGPNRALQVGLSHCMIGNSAMRDLLLTLNIPAPSEFGMQRQANNISQVLEDLNKEDMDERLGRLVKKCEYKVGNESIAPIIIEGDCRYNNALWTSAGKTPYQPATQAVYTISENVTAQKQIIGLGLKNKLCKKAETLRKSSKNISCPNHSGHCSANIDPEDPIANEGQMVSEIFTNMFEKHPNLAVKYFTTDGDSRAFSGLQAIQAEKSPVIVNQMRDPRHLSENMRHAIKREKFGLQMFPGHNKTTRDKQQSSFALELSKRCTAEFEACHRKNKGDLAKMREDLATVPNTLLLCYQGDCTQCNKYSFVCGSNKKIPWVKGFQQQNMEIYPNDTDKELLLSCINMRLGYDVLAKTHLNTSTQKTEAFNRVLSRCNPKSVTLKRNFPGRAHSATHLTNCGIAESTRSKCAAVGAPLLSGTRVFTQLKHKDQRVRYIRSKMKSPSYKAGRIDRRVQRYQKYHEKNAETIIYYQKGLFNDLPALGDHTYISKISKISKGECQGTSGLIKNSNRRRKGTLQK